MSVTRKSSLVYVSGSGGNPVPVLEEIELEANTCERGWAPMEGAAIHMAAPWRVIEAIDTELGTRHPVAIMGLEQHGPRSRRSLGPMLKEVARFFEDRELRREAKLFRIADLVTTEQVGALLGVQAGTLSQWRRRYQDFPSPLLEGQPFVWDRREMWDWGRRSGRIKLGRSDRRIDPRKT
jgi:hypothetical protein